MRIELLYFDGCPHHDELLPHLEELLARTGHAVEITLIRIDTPEQAEQHRFLGSPTVRLDGIDIDPTAAERDDYGIKCRLYRTDEGLRGTPPDDLFLRVLSPGSGRLSDLGAAARGRRG